MTNVFRNAAAEFIFIRTYSRGIDAKGRRENWEETVDRYMKFIQDERGDKIPAKVIRKIREKILNHEVMPSMRALWAAGDAAKESNVALYNCSYANIDSIDSFSEMLYILMCGAGVGFSVELKHVEKLPIVPKFLPSNSVITIEDSKYGWADSVKQLMTSLYSGYDVNFNYNNIRGAGERLKTMGGRASGPAPLVTLHDFIKNTFKIAQGRKLTTLECHDICNQIAEIVVMGGVRRSSQISLSDLMDEDMRKAKTGSFPVRRYMSNNSAVYDEKPDAVTFLKEWAELAASGTGERGIFNRQAARNSSPKRRDSSLIAGTNPCGEIMLRSRQFCNLSEVVVRETDDLDTLLEKVETATWVGAIQSTFTDFKYLSPEWKINCDEERLLGVSITGQMDAPHLLTEEALGAMKARALRVAKQAATKLGGNFSASITCTKPSGTVSQLVDSSSGIHPRFDKYYVRRYRISGMDPLCQMMQVQGFPLSPENGQSKEDWNLAKIKLKETGNIFDAKAVCSVFQEGADWDYDKVNTWVASFPIKAPTTALVTREISAFNQLEWYKKIQTKWCEHNASCTIYVKEHEWFSVGNWVYENWDIVNGLSFLPYGESNYKQMPYESLTKEQYEKMVAGFKTIDYSQLVHFEQMDNTQGSQALACMGSSCEIV